MLDSFVLFFFNWESLVYLSVAYHVGFVCGWERACP